ncbi:hypothetical protein CRD_00886 [Raphidiopsis brookii D9]|nr:hypothetical protein CRD_00886 [Raphidiopsis brookii D9]
MTITVKDVSTCKWDFFVWNADIMTQPNYGWQWKIGTEEFAIVFHMFCFAFNQQNDGTSPSGNVEWFVGGV